MEMMLPMAAPDDDARRTHRIVDGDTLPALAQRYLGTPDRAREILEANRNVLRDAELLPIGVELEIPPRRRPEGATPEAPPVLPLAPVPHMRPSTSEAMRPASVYSLASAAG